MSRQSRKPKGSSEGGQFAPSQNPESDINLGDIGEIDESSPGFGDLRQSSDAYDDFSFDGWDRERANELFSDDSHDDLTVEEFLTLFERAANNAELERLEDEKRRMLGKIYDEILSERAGGPVTENPDESVWAIVYHDDTGDFARTFSRGTSEADAVQNAIDDGKFLRRDFVEATDHGPHPGKMIHENFWPTGETLRDARGHEFLTSGLIETIPDLYATESTPMAEKMVHAHYFSSSGDWYITELDKDSGRAFGHCDLGMGYPEWGYVSLLELESVRHPQFPRSPAVERDLHFEPKPVKELGLGDESGNGWAS